MKSEEYKEKRKEYNRRSYEKNKEKLKEYNRKYYNEHKEKAKAYGKNYYKKNKKYYKNMYLEKTKWVNDNLKRFWDNLTEEKKIEIMNKRAKELLDGEQDE